MSHTKALQDKIGKPLADGMIQSFSLNGELVDRINVLFLKFDTWLHITVSEGSTLVKDLGNENPSEKVEFEAERHNFQYVIMKADKAFPELKPFVGATLGGVKELVWKNDESYSCGLKLNFSNGSTLIIQSDADDNLSVSTNNSLLADVKEKLSIG